MEWLKCIFAWPHQKEAFQKVGFLNVVVALLCTSATRMFMVRVLSEALHVLSWFSLALFWLVLFVAPRNSFISWALLVLQHFFRAVARSIASVTELIQQTRLSLDRFWPRLTSLSKRYCCERRMMCGSLFHFSYSSFTVARSWRISLLSLANTECPCTCAFRAF